MRLAVENRATSVSDGAAAISDLAPDRWRSQDVVRADVGISLGRGRMESAADPAAH